MKQSNSTYEEASSASITLTLVEVPAFSLEGRAINFIFKQALDPLILNLIGTVNEVQLEYLMKNFECHLTEFNDDRGSRLIKGDLINEDHLACSFSSFNKRNPKIVVAA